MSEINTSLIDQTFDSNGPLDPPVVEAIKKAIEALDRGQIRVCEKTANGWTTHQWIKKAILLYFRVSQMRLHEVGGYDPSMQHPFKIFAWVDKIPVKKWTGIEGVRVVPPAMVREGAFVEKGCILMPSYINIGAHVGAGTMVDTWATVGSCAQIGVGVHLSGGVGIGGVLEPVQANPVIIEDHAFIGSRCVVVEGVHVEESAVLGAGVVLTSTTRILDVSGSQTVEYRGRVPANSVVIPGTMNKTFPAGTFGVTCALIIGKRSASTDKKTSLTTALRDYEVSV